jgi:protein-S-isoprenylcysteine O-methyltransferase Ste14
MMEKDTDDHPSIVIAPPLLFLICMGGGFLLDYLFPLKIIRWPLWPRIICSGILIMISAYFALGSIRILLRNKTPFDPSKPTKTIVCQGPFCFSRNPMYLALLLFLTGVAIVSGSIWLILAVVALLIVLDILAVRPEEEYLERNFGGQYLAYKAKVRRWL